MSGIEESSSDAGFGLAGVVNGMDSLGGLYIILLGLGMGGLRKPPAL